MELKNNIRAFHAKTRRAWRKWLEKNYESENAVWLIIYHKASKTASIYYDEAVEEALCFGWVDSKAMKRDEESYYLYFAKRKPRSNWSKPNRERAAKMISKGLMTARGQELIDLAKATGTWEALLEVQNNVVPDDLLAHFKNNEIAYQHFLAFSPSSRRIILEWILNAKRPETRQKRIIETVELAARNIKAHHPVQ
jgi:uncharacterized protein YdeI (YjbR/CyaY-like superfamily)